MNLGRQFLIARKDMNDGNGITQGEVFEETGINIATISNIENGKSDPKQSTLEKLSNFYGYKLQLVK